MTNSKLLDILRQTRSRKESITLGGGVGWLVGKYGKIPTDPSRDGSGPAAFNFLNSATASGSRGRSLMERSVSLPKGGAGLHFVVSGYL
jgi:hypothetical protein